ncbi:MAG: flagellar filament capping protein FliD [Planctomycetota bacterium]|jgi:flagellar hook-associated protein 2
MSGISTGIGLISGIDTASLIDQLIAIDSQPVELLQNRVAGIDAQKAALLSISAQLLAVRSAVSNLNDLSFFRRFSSTSTNEDVIKATADDKAVPGTYTFSVRSLVSSHSMLSRGFADTDQSPLGVGTISVEVGEGKVDKSTSLDYLRGGLGVRRGVITITDRAGNSADVDLRSAVTMDDVLDAINMEAGINVRASVTGIDTGTSTGDRLVIEDLNADATGSLMVVDKNGGQLAANLGIAGVASALTPDRIDGDDLVYLGDGFALSDLLDGNGVGSLFDGEDLIFDSSNGDTFDFSVSLSKVLASRLDTRLDQLNGGNGVRLGRFQVTDRAGNTGVIDLADASRPEVATIGDVIQRINEDAAAAGVEVSATVVNSSLFINDNTGLDGEGVDPLIIEDLPDDAGNQGFSAADLGVVGSFDDSSSVSHDLYRMETIGDLIRAINGAQGNEGYISATVSDDGNSIELASTGPFAGTYTVRAGEGSTAAADLGLEDAVIDPLATTQTRTLLSGLNTVLLDSLRGGSGVTKGSLSITDRAGNTTGAIDFTSARSLKDVVDLINNNAPVDVNGDATIVAQIDASGTGLVIQDKSQGQGALSIADVTGTLAADLGIATPPGGTLEDQVTSDNLQLQYISRQTKLEDLNNGLGVSLGEFQIIDTTGFVHQVELPANATDVGGVIDAINQLTPDTIEARINDTGDGIVIIDTSTGGETLTVQDVDGGSMAEALRLAGTAKPGQNYIDGSYEIRVDVSAGDTLNDVVKKLNEAGGQFSASVVNDGGAVNPYSMTVSSGITGSRGELVINSSGLDLGLTTLSRANDAVVAIGGDDAENPILVTSSTNTLDDVIEGVSLDLLSVGDGPVTIDVAQDVDSVVESVASFVDGYNEVQSVLDDLTAVDPETFERAVLQGDRTVDTIRSRLYRAVSRQVQGVTNEFSRLFQVGISQASGNRLEFDEEKFRAAYEEDPLKVEALFTTTETGFGQVIQDTLDEMTRDVDGVIGQRTALLDDQQELLTSRIDDLNILLDAKRTRLQAQFVAMERALADLQGQQTALSQLASLG